MLGLDPNNLPEKLSIRKKVEEFETEAKRKFVEEPANMKLLIVVDKLLTGFDAPPCTYLYVDKGMQDHALFQAICRVNRLDNDSDNKDFGYIVDYKQLFGDLKHAMDVYTSGAFSGYDEEDVAGLIKDRSKEALSFFQDTFEELEELCEGVDEPKGDIEYLTISVVNPLRMRRRRKSMLACARSCTSWSAVLSVHSPRPSRIWWMFRCRRPGRCWTR